MSKMHITNKLVLIFLLFSVIPSSFVSIIVFVQTDTMIQNAKTEIENQNIAKFEGLAYQIGLQVTDWLNEKTDDVSAFARHPSIRSGMQLIKDGNSSQGISEQQTTLNFLLSLYTDYTEIMILAKNGTVLVSSFDSDRISNHATGDKRSDAYFSGAINRNGSSLDEDSYYFKDLHLADDVQTYSMTMSHVIRDLDGEISGVIVLRLDTHKFFNFFNKRDQSGEIIKDFYEQLGMPDSGDIYLVNQDNFAFSTSRFWSENDNFILNTNVSNALERNQILQQGREKGESFGFATDYRNVKIFGFYLSLDKTVEGTEARSDWFVEIKEIDLPYVIVIEVDETELLAPINQLYDLKMSSVIIIFIITLTISFIITVRSDKIPKRRTNYTVVQDIFKFLQQHDNVFKTDFEQIGFNVRNVEDWMDIIIYIQSKPAIKQIKKGRISIYELENGTNEKNSN